MKTMETFLNTYIYFQLYLYLFLLIENLYKSFKFLLITQS